MWLCVDGRAQAADGGAPLHAAPSLDYAQLETLVRQHSPLVSPATREAALAALEVDQARLYDNPSLDVGIGTWPLGRLTPPDLDHPYANVPNYGAGLAYTFPLKKRAPRRRRAQQLALAASAEVDQAARETTLALASVLGELASATLRREGMRGLVTSGERSLELVEARLRAHFGTPLEVDRLQVELERTRQQVLGVEAETEAALADCAQLLGSGCEGFDDADAARAYLLRWASASEASSAGLRDRPDLRALDFQIGATRADAELAAAQAIPDPTVRLGYLHDRFIVAGNQRNSISLNVSVPLALFDHGQVRQRAASAARRGLIEERTRRINAAHARIPTLVQRLTLQRARCGALTDTLLPKANAVLHDLERAVENQLLPLTDVLQARRNVAELLIEEAESCGDAYQASLELLRELPPRGESR